MKINPNSIFRYRGNDRKIFKIWKGYQGFINDHHIIPREHRNHPLIQKTQFDINGNFNLFIMPINKAKDKFNLHPNTQYHTNHPKYNRYVKNKLDKIYNNTECSDTREYHLWLFVCYLREKLKYNFKYWDL
jgi:hypothetical protein